MLTDELFPFRATLAFILYFRVFLGPGGLHATKRFSGDPFLLPSILTARSAGDVLPLIRLVGGSDLIGCCGSGSDAIGCCDSGGFWEASGGSKHMGTSGARCAADCMISRKPPQYTFSSSADISLTAGGLQVLGGFTKLMRSESKTRKCRHIVSSCSRVISTNTSSGILYTIF